MNKRVQVRLWLATTAAAVALLGSDFAASYPLDGEGQSGIRRLEGYRNAQQQPSGPKLSPGALLGVADITLGLRGYDGPDFDQFPEDLELKAALDALFSARDPSYGLVVVDVSDPNHLRWAGLRPDTRQNVGSVGKILCMVGLFDALRRAFPDPADRQRVLATTLVRGGDWVLGDEHSVPRFDPATGRNVMARLQAGDEFRLSEWLDHAISASANGAGAVIWREAMLIRHFGASYPVPLAEAEAYFRDTPKSQLAAEAQAVMVEPLTAAGINTADIRQGSFWTSASKRLVPGTSSYATPRELSRIMFRIDQGRMVDEWSSLEMKRYLYITKRRYRYVYAPELSRSATFFKSGSLYSCKLEADFRCRQYQGNERNFMNSLVSVETPAGAPTSRYFVAMISNVLRQNSAWDHSRIGAAIHEMVLTRKPVDLRDQANSAEIDSAGKSD